MNQFSFFFKATMSVLVLGALCGCGNALNGFSSSSTEQISRYEDSVRKRMLQASGQAAQSDANGLEIAPPIGIIQSCSVGNPQLKGVYQVVNPASKSDEQIISEVRSIVQENIQKLETYLSQANTDQYRTECAQMIAVTQLMLQANKGILADLETNAEFRAAVVKVIRQGGMGIVI